MSKKILSEGCHGFHWLKILKYIHPDYLEHTHKNSGFLVKLDRLLDGIFWQNNRQVGQIIL